jgi:hypothetical protein
MRLERSIRRDKKKKYDASFYHVATKIVFIFYRLYRT